MAGDRKRNLDVVVRLNKEGNLEVIRDVVDDIKGVDPAAKDAARAVEKLSDSVQNGFRGSYRATTDAGHALEVYRAELERAQLAGEQVTTEQVQQLRALEKEYDSLIKSVGEYRASQKRVADDIKSATNAALGQVEASEKQRTSFLSIEDLLGEIDPKMAKFAVTVVGVKEAFEFGYEAGLKLQKVLDFLSEGRFGESISGLFSGIAEKIVGVGQGAELLRNQMNVLAKNGIDVAGKSAEEVGRLFDEYTEKLRANHGEAVKLDKAYKEWTDSLGPLPSDLDKITKSLLTNIERLRETETALSDAKFAEIVRPQIDALVAEYERLGQEPPQAIQDLIRELEFLAGATDDATSKMASEWGSTKDEIQKAVDDLRAAYQPIPDDLAEQADALGITINAWEKHNVVFTANAEPGKWLKVADAARQAGKGLKEGGKEAEEHATKVEGAAKAAGDFAGKGGAAGTAASDIGKGMGEAATGAGNLAGSLASIPEKVSGVGDAVAGELVKIESKLGTLIVKANAVAEAMARAKQAAETGDPGAPVTVPEGE